MLYNNNVTQGYKPPWLFLYWVDYSHQSSGDININNYVLERPSLRELSVWCDGIEVKRYKPKTMKWSSIGTRSINISLSGLEEPQTQRQFG